MLLQATILHLHVVSVHAECGTKPWVNPVLSKALDIKASSPSSRYTDPKVQPSSNIPCMFVQAARLCASGHVVSSQPLVLDSKATNLKAGIVFTCVVELNK